MIEKLEVKEWLELNAKLQQKKNKLRKALGEMGILKREGQNSFDRYKYFSEAQYKELFTGLFSKYGLELTASEASYNHIDGTEKMAFGVDVTWEFALTDIDTGFFEKSLITGEGLDKGDKAGYKANTGAIKYYLANTFMVATGDDPETESPDGNKTSNKNSAVNYRNQLIAKLKELGIDMTDYAKEHGLNSKSSQDEFKQALADIEVK